MITFALVINKKIEIMSNIKYRVIENRSGLYNHLEIQLLVETKRDVFLGSIEVVGSICFQQTKGEDDWYGMSFKTDVSRYSSLERFTKMCKLVNSSTSFRSQPSEIIELLGGGEFFICNQEWFAKKDIGKYCYYVVRNGIIYSRMVAKNVADANKKIVKLNLESPNYMYLLGDGFEIE